MFSRAVAPNVIPDASSLTAALAGIGMNLTSSSKLRQEPNIEDTLLFASAEAMEKSELRVLALLVTWFGVHFPWVNADRLTRLVLAHPSTRIRALWSALARWKRSDRRFTRLAKAYKGQRIDLVGTGSDFLIRRDGEDPRFENTPLRVARNVLRDRAHDVLPPRQLAVHHYAYRYRVLIGPSYRADMWAALDREPTVSAAELARRTYGSFATAWHVKRAFGLLQKNP